MRLHGRDAERMADLSEKAAEEQQQFIRAQWLDAQDVERFRYMDPRVEAQLQVRGAAQRTTSRQPGGCKPTSSCLWLEAALCA